MDPLFGKALSSSPTPGIWPDRLDTARTADALALDGGQSSYRSTARLLPNYPSRYHQRTRQGDVLPHAEGFHGHPNPKALMPPGLI